MRLNPRVHTNGERTMGHGSAWWRRRRERIFARDGHRCAVCGSAEGLTVDHIRARALGGTDALRNLQTLCGPCNTQKSMHEGRLSLERARPVIIDCSIVMCPWCGDRPRDRTPRRSVGVVAVTTVSDP